MAGSSRAQTGVKTDIIPLSLEIDDPLIAAYLTRFDEGDWPDKAVEAMRVGVIALESASPTLDTRVVQQAFTAMQGGLGVQVESFREDLGKLLRLHFGDGEGHEGTVPKRLGSLFNEGGELDRTFSSYFCPKNGTITQILTGHIGPGSAFANKLDPERPDGVVKTIETKVRGLVELKMNEVLAEFDLNEDESAIRKLQTMLDGWFDKINRHLGIEEGKEEEATKGHLKGLDFQSNLYDRVAEWGHQLEDETDFVHGTPGTNGRKLGDILITLGETTSASGRRIVIEIKDKNDRMKFRDVAKELQDCKETRGADCGIYVFSKGCEPPEVGDFRRVGEDFYCTVDREDVISDGPLAYLEQAYKIARIIVVAAKRKEDEGQLDLERVEQHIDALIQWVPRLGEIITKARTVKSHGVSIEDAAAEIKKDMETRLNEILALLRRGTGT